MSAAERYRLIADARLARARALAALRKAKRVTAAQALRETVEAFPVPGVRS